MPTLNLKVAPPVDAARAQALASALTELTADVLGKRREVTVVTIESFSAGHWFVGGSPVARATAQLQIHITAGTNTTEQKARFVEAAFALLQRQLAPEGALEPASYAQVHELPATDWGYGGRTQAARQAERALRPLPPEPRLNACAPSHSPAHPPPSSPQTTAPPST
jgi:4-oxalocrotonate tautomerase